MNWYKHASVPPRLLADPNWHGNWREVLEKTIELSLPRSTGITSDPAVHWITHVRESSVLNVFQSRFSADNKLYEATMQFRPPGEWRIEVSRQNPHAPESPDWSKQGPLGPKSEPEDTPLNPHDWQRDWIPLGAKKDTGMGDIVPPIVLHDVGPYEVLQEVLRLIETDNGSVT